MPKLTDTSEPIDRRVKNAVLYCPVLSCTVLYCPVLSCLVCDFSLRNSSVMFSVCSQWPTNAWSYQMGSKHSLCSTTLTVGWFWTRMTTNGAFSWASMSKTHFTSTMRLLSPSLFWMRWTLTQVSVTLKQTLASWQHITHCCQPIDM